MQYSIHTTPTHREFLIARTVRRDVCLGGITTRGKFAVLARVISREKAAKAKVVVPKLVM